MKISCLKNKQRNVLSQYGKRIAENVPITFWEGRKTKTGSSVGDKIGNEAGFRA